MVDWAAAGSAIAAAFADPDLLAVHGSSGTFDLPAVRSERELEDGGRAIVYEVRRTGWPRPRKRDHFTHRGTSWTVINVAECDDPGAWSLTVEAEGEDNAD